MKAKLTAGRVFIFWSPLAATWLMMSLEGPFIAAVIARLPEATYNLAAYGVAFAFALLLESPIIMMTSASTALAADGESYRRLRNFNFFLNTAITVAWGIVLLPAVFYPIAEGLIRLPHEVALLTHTASVILLPWPAAIGYRRFYQGVLIRNSLTRLVAYGTVIRLVSMAATALLLYLWTNSCGAVVGASALSAGVTLEAVASRLMAWGSVRHLTAGGGSIGSAPQAAENYRSITTFYYPLALTSMLILGANPLVTFFLGQSRLPVESLAVLPVVNSLVFIFRGIGLAFQEVGIALFGEGGEGYPALKRFALILGGATTGILLIIAWTPLAGLWFEVVSGLTPLLTSIALPATRIMAVMPGLSVLLSFEQAMLVRGGRTKPVTWGTAVEVAGIAGTLIIGIWPLGMVGVTAASCAFIVGRLGSNTFLFPHMIKAVRKASSGRKC